MKNIFMVAAIALMATACQHTILPVATNKTGTEVTNASGNPILLGHTPDAVFQKAPYTSWYTPAFEKYTTDSNAVQQLSPLLKNISMDIFLGSWCGDSKREVPRMMKILQNAGMDTSRVSLIFVDNSSNTYKQTPLHEEKDRNIHHVPTFIVYDHNREIGRIVESPVVSLEKDLITIASHDPYTPNYKAIHYWLSHVNKRNTTKSDRSLQQLSETVKPLCKHYGEFNTYGYVCLAAGKTNEALNVFRMNTMIYPQTPGVFDSLGEAYARTGNKTAAIEAYEKVLLLKPGDANAVKQLAELKMP